MRKNLKTRRTSLVISVATFVGLALAGVERASAATFIVNDGDVAGLITAINTANTNGEDDTIELEAHGTYTLTVVNNGSNGLPVIGSDTSHKLTIQGSGVTIERSSAGGTPAFRILSIGSGADVTISGLTITNGLANGSFPANQGGGIYNDHATLTVANSTISGNSATFGGGINNNGESSGSATVTVANSTFSGNSASFGGGINNDGELSGGSATLTVTNSTFSGNSATISGGGIRNTGQNSGHATLTVKNSTFSGNSAGLALNAGGIENNGSFNGVATLTIGSTILNKAGASGVNLDSSAFGGTETVTSLGYNLSSDGTGPNNGTTDQINTNPLLGPLQNNGGPTFTHAPLCGSPAIDQGKNVSASATDQRGFSRTFDDLAIPNATGGDGTDIGAVESPIHTFTVINNNNSGAGSLRQAILDANASAGSDAIAFVPAVTGTITLTSGELLITDCLVINGPGANVLAVNGNAASRVFYINSGKTVTISGLTITNGTSTGDFPDDSGGGIYNDHATVTVSNCTMSGNSANGNGGGIFNFGESGSATLTVSNSTLSGNSAFNLGGGILNYGRTSGSATLTLNNSTISNNSATSGGGIFNYGFTGSATLTINNSTLSGNSATSSGGGINNFGAEGSAPLNIGDTILKTGALGANIFNNSGTVNSNGYNLSSDGTGPNNGTTDQINTDPMLGPLQDNGGPTFTHALLCDSPAIDQGKNLSGSATDQRGAGFARIFDDPAKAPATDGDNTDIGAFEAQAPVPSCNTAPTIMAASGVTRQQGAASSNSQIATVNDNEDEETALTVTVNGSTFNGVTVSGIAVDSSGNVTADVVASCSASNASFTLRVTDTGGLYDEDTLNVSVTASNPPVITLKPATVLQPNVNHSYRTFTISQMVQSATDDCDGNVINNVVIEKATSDEVENAPSPGDGNTLNDIVIASGCKSVQLRAERDGSKDGRVYLVTLRVSDTSGNVTRAVYKVSVPVGKKPAVDSGVAYTVLSSCPP